MNHKTLARMNPRRLLFVCLGKLFYRDRVDGEGNIIRPKRFFTSLNQRLIEKGFTPPWIWSAEECHRFWASRQNNEESAGNRPVDYAAKEMGIIDFLDGFWKPEVVADYSILEVGCNCGVNLHGLRSLGYRHLSGIEMNGNAVAEMRRSFPDLEKVAEISLGTLEELLPKMPSKSVDVVFTMGVLMHVHPRSCQVFSEMVRIARRYIVIIEAEIANCGYLFARNYRRVFGRLGCAQVKSTLLTREAFPYVSRGYDGLTARLFKSQGVGL
ncbi:MAG: class I SAM-dependent methyltransferase [Thermoanaerobaculia bacterium]